tara:strand:- start:338 stop:1324 length:987 start_codon:yes stop_codon:yes gene_type:complete
MKSKPFGKTGLTVSEVVLGGGFVGGILLNQDEKIRNDAFNLAMKSGISWIDTAPSYGMTKSETNIGILLRETKASPTVSTKVAIDVKNILSADDQIKRSVEESLTRLGQDRLALLNLHNPITRDTESTDGFGNIGIPEMLSAGGILDSLEQLKNTGVVEHIGITALGDTKCCHEVISTGRIDAAQIYYNMINSSAAFSSRKAILGQDFSGLIDACLANKVGIMAIRVFAAGVLASENRHGREILITENTTIAQEEQLTEKLLQTLNYDFQSAANYGTRAETALRFNLSNPNIDCTVVGLAEMSHLEQVINAVKAGPLPDDALKIITSL